MGPVIFGLTWENAIVALVGDVPIQILYGYVMTRLFDIPRPALFTVAYALFALVLVPFSSLFGMTAYIAIETILCVAPAFIARDCASHRVLMIGSSLVVVIVAYLAFLVLWMLVVDDPFSYQEKYENLSRYAVASVIHWIVLDALFVLLRRAQSRWLTPNTERYIGEGPKYFIWFPLLQVPFLLIALVGINAVDAWSPLLVVLVLLMGAFLLVSDLVLFRAIDRFALECFEAWRIETLEHQLAKELQLFDDLSTVLENSAQLRHNLRNHLQIIEVLASRGEFESARNHVRDLLGEIELMNARDESVVLRSEKQLAKFPLVAESAPFPSDPNGGGGEAWG